MSASLRRSKSRIRMRPGILLASLGSICLLNPGSISANDAPAAKGEAETPWAKPKGKFHDEYGIYAPFDANMEARRFPASMDFPSGPDVGEALPECKLPNQKGEMVDLHASLDGKKGVVVFYRSSVW